MSRHEYSLLFFRSMQELVDVFELNAVWADKQLFQGTWRWGYRLAEEDEDCSMVRVMLAEHARETRDQIAQLWHSRTDPRDPACDEVEELVRHAWWNAKDWEYVPSSRSFALPDVVEQRPEAIPRVAGVHYFHSRAWFGIVHVPRGSHFVTAFRDYEVPDDDWKHIVGIADPGYLP